MHPRTMYKNKDGRRCLMAATEAMGGRRWLSMLKADILREAEQERRDISEHGERNAMFERVNRMMGVR